MIIGAGTTGGVTIYGMQTHHELLRALCDGFFVGGMLLFGYGCLLYARNEGIFDGLTYSFHSLFASRNLAGEKQVKKYSEYKEEKKAKRKSAKSELVSGLFYTVISFILLAVYVPKNYITEKSICQA